MDSFGAISSTDAHYSQQQQQQQPSPQRQQQPWPPHILHPAHQSQSSFPSPVSPPSSIADPQHYPPFYHTQQQQQQQSQQSQPQSSLPDNIHRASLSLNLSSLSVASPTNLSPINPPPSHPAALSPITPISPASSLQNSHPFTQHQPHHHIPPHSQFQFTPPDPPPPSQPQPQNQVAHYDDHHPTQFDRRLATPTTSRSSSSSTSSASISLPRKRSFTSNASSQNGTLVEEAIYDDSQMEYSPSYDDITGYAAAPSLGGPNTAGGRCSPVDGSGSGGEDGMLCGVSNTSTIGLGVAGSVNILSKPMATNNFVTKLYQMINDPKSQHFIAWTELGTSFVVSNVGEFSRSILGSHFKHNNFSSFVRQLNMYGFHKINRTPRAQRTSTDAQTWEFSHHKFLRGRPDLLDEIKRKALEPDPAVRHRVELPGEVAAQLGAMREENRRVWEHLAAERRKVEKLVHMMGRLWDVVGKGFPGSVPAFPSDLFDSGCDSPNIYITSPPANSPPPPRFPPPLSMRISSQSLGSLHSLSSPNSSPTMADADFPIQNLHSHDHRHHAQPPSLSRQHSFQHVSFSRSEGSGSTPLPSSPGSVIIDLFDSTDGESPVVGRGSTKRQRTSNGNDSAPGGNGGGGGGGGGEAIPPNSGTGGPPVAVSGKKLSRARSDSAPLGYVLGGLNAPWNAATRPRSGSGIAGNRVMGVMGVTNMVSRNGAACPTVGGGSGLPPLQAPPMMSISSPVNNTSAR